MAESTHGDGAKKDETKPRRKSCRGNAAASCPLSGGSYGNHLASKVLAKPGPPAGAQVVPISVWLHSEHTHMLSQWDGPCSGHPLHPGVSIAN